MREIDDEFFLPQALLDEVLQKADYIESYLNSSLESVKEVAQEIRDSLAKDGYIRKFDGSCIFSRNVCGVDGSYVVESLLSMDVICSAAVAVEGFAPSDDHSSLWTEPHHDFAFLCTNHYEGISNIAESIMLMKEVNLAVKSPHSVVLIDGSAFTPFATVSSGVSYLLRNKTLSQEIYREFIFGFRRFKENYFITITNSDPEKIYCYISKYVASKVLSEKFNLRRKIDDRTLATNILKEGEFLILKEWATSSGNIQDPETGELIDASKYFENIVTIFFRPRNELPALKIDLSANILKDSARLGFLLSAIEYQCASPSILEPYPLFLAHETARQLKLACIAAVEAASVKSSENLKISEVETFMNFYSFRTEGG